MWSGWPQGKLPREISEHTQKEVVQVQKSQRVKAAGGKEPVLGQRAQGRGEGAAQAEINDSLAEACGETSWPGQGTGSESRAK